jgi:hypothetical protein
MRRIERPEPIMNIAGMIEDHGEMIVVVFYFGCYVIPTLNIWIDSCVFRIGFENVEVAEFSSQLVTRDWRKNTK